MGLSPVILGAIADAWSFGAGIFFLGLFTTLSSILIKFLPVL
jgi:hypothetical protein